MLDVRAVIGIVALLVAATIGVYARVLHQDFVYWDDNLHVFENPYIDRGIVSGIGHFWRHPYGQLYIPVSYTAFMLLARASRMPHADPGVTVFDTLLNPRVFHAANLALHTMNVLLVWIILSRVTRRIAPSAAGALLFALHPLQVESVAWISELRGLLSGCFALAAILCYLTAVGTKDKPAEGAPVRRATYWAAILLTVLGLLSKPGIVGLPLALFALDRWYVARPLRACLLSVSPWLLLAIPLTIITHAAQPVPAMDTVAVWQRPFVAGDALAFYLAKLFAPVGLTIDYGRTPGSVASGTAFATSLVPMAMGILVYMRRKQNPWLVGATLVSLAFLLPVLGLAPFIFQSYSTVADRYMYLTMLGPSLVVSMMLAQASAPGAKGGYGVMAAALIGLGALTFQQVKLWDGSYSLLGNAVRRAPGNANLQLDYEMAMRRLGRLSEAEEQFRDMVRERPDNLLACEDLGATLIDENKFSDAVDVLQTAVSLAPANANIRRNLGVALQRVGRPSEAVPQLQEATRLDPGDAEGHNDLGNALDALGRYDEAARECRKAVELRPDFPEALFSLGQILSHLGQETLAEADCRKAVQLAPNDTRTYFALGGVLLREGQTAGALVQYRHAVSIDPGDELPHFNLGCALMQAGDTADAISELKQAVQIQPLEQNINDLGMAYETAGDVANARAEFQLALSMYPSSSIARQQLANLPPE
ncbi:MAG: tetratricopeptide repeat protein [Capsulimonadaceae bacterium]